MMKYIIYCRKSTDEGTEKQIQSIPDQMEECIQFAENNKLVIADRPAWFEVFESEEEIRKQDIDPIWSKTYKKYRDLFIIKEQKTAKNPWVREKRKELIKRVRAWKVKGIISYHPDRQARNMEEWWALITLVDNWLVDLKYSRFHFEPTATGKMMLGFLFVFSKNYSDTISENVTRWLKTSIERWKAVGKNKYWYRINSEWYFEPDDQNFELMKKAFHMKIYEHKTNEFIWEYLNTHWFTRSISWKKSPTRMNWKDFSRIWMDPFYYWIHIYWQAQSDQREFNQHYQALITEDEYLVLQKKLSAGVMSVEARDENMIINPLGKSLLQSEDGCFFVHDFPNKQRYVDKLEELKKTKPTATLFDVVKSSQILYTMKNKKSDQKGMSISYAEIEKQILKFISLIQINDTNYKWYVEYMTSEYLKERHLREEQRQRLQLQRNIQSNKLNDFVTRNLWLTRDDTESEAYSQEKTRLEKEIYLIDDQLTKLNEGEHHALVALEWILDVFKDIVKKFQKSNYVRKRNFINLLFSNILITKERQVKLLPFSYVGHLIVAESAVAPQAFEHFYWILHKLTVSDIRRILTVWIEQWEDKNKIIKRLTKKQVVLYGLDVDSD